MPKHAQKHKNAMKKSIAEKWPIVVFQLWVHLYFIEFLPPPPKKKCFTKIDNRNEILKDIFVP